MISLGYSRAFMVAAAAAALASGAAAADVTSLWLDGQSGNWTDVDLWSTPEYPDNGGTTYVARINSSASTVTLDVPITVNGFDLFAGKLGGSQTLTVQNSMNWSAGTLSGSGTIDVQNELVLLGGARGFSGFTINVASAATTQWLGGSIFATATEGGVFNNNGTFESMTDDSWTWINLQTPVFNNSGTFIKSDGTAGTRQGIWTAFNNSGFVDVQTSGVWFSGGGASSGSFAVAAGAELAFSDYNQSFADASAPTTTFGAASSISSLGTVIFANDFGDANTTFGGTYNSAHTIINPGAAGLVHFTSTSTVGDTTVGDVEILNGTLKLDTSAGTAGFGDVNLSAGTLATSNDLFINSLTWASGNIVGDTFQDVSAGSLVFSGTGQKLLKNARLYNGVDSVATISQGSLDIQNGNLINLAGGTFDIQGNVTFINTDSANTDSVFVNAGYLSAAAGAGVADVVDVLFSNNGTVQVQSGTLRLGAGGDHLGAFAIDSGATLTFAGSTYNSFYNVYSGGEIAAASGATLNIAGGADVAIQDGANLNISGNTHVSGKAALRVGGDASAGNLVVDGGGSVELSGIGKTLHATSLSIDTGSDSVIDLGMNRIALSYSGSAPISSIKALILSGYNGGDWAGAGITSSAAATDSTKFVGYFDDTSADELLVAYTWFGDATLDGLVDVADLKALAMHWQQSGQEWFSGDFNYDGLVDQTDLGLMALNWSHSGQTPFPEILANFGLPPVTVPEPGMLGLMLLPLLGLRRRQRSATSTPHSGHRPREARRS
jgi:hypothetical protein